MVEYPEYKPEDIYEDLKRIIPEEFVSISIFESANNATGPYAFELRKEELPYAVVRPGSTEEVSNLMKYANTKKIPVHVRGSGTSLHGASMYRHRGIVLNVSRLTHLNIAEEDGFVEFGAGHRVEFVKEKLEEKGYFLPLLPGSIRVASIGGIFANNTSGHAVDSCLGRPRDYVLGLEVVLPTGEVLQTGTRSLRRIAGTDLTQYFVGGDGLLGVITNIRMRLVPSVKNAYGVAVFDDLVPLIRAVQRIYWEKAPPPLSLDLIDKRTAEASYKIAGLEPPPGSLIHFHVIGQTEDEASFNINKLFEVMRKESPLELKRVDTVDEWRELSKPRELAFLYLCQSKKGRYCISEIVSTLSNLVDCAKDVLNMADGMPTLSKLGQPYLAGHLGALIIHPGFVIPMDWPAEEKAKVIDELFLKEAELNIKYGTCGGEWGQFSKRSSFYIGRYGEKNYQLVRGVKRLFDPNNILNPSVLPDE